MSVYRSQSSLQRISRACAFRSFPVRYFRATARPRAQDPPAFSAGSDTSQLTSILNTLLSPTGRWSLSEGGRGVERGFKFKSFKAAWSFMNKVADECRAVRHHPEWANVYNSVFVKWTTHNPSGISGVDLEMAGICDRLASRSETNDASSSKDSETLKPLANKAGSSSGDSRGKPEQEAQAQKEKAAVESQEDTPKDKQSNPSDIGGQPS